MNIFTRNAALTLSVFLASVSAAATSPALSSATAPPSDAVGGAHDFDFFVGHWKSHHRKLKERLVDSHDWVEFDGALVMYKLMDGSSNVDDTVFEVPGQPYWGVALRTFDAKLQQWSIWWFDSRTPSALDPPVRGSFSNGIGTFYADDTFRGKPIRVRFVWSGITADTCHWEQAFSGDGGKTWETNWIMDFKRDNTPRRQEN